MSKINQIDIGFGKIAELIFARYYKGLGRGKKYFIKDTSNSSYHRKLGVDFEVVDREANKQILAEVKHQKALYYSDEIIFETQNEFRSGSQRGWFYTSQADELYILASKSINGVLYAKGFHCVDLKRLRRYLNQNEHVQDEWINDDTKAYRLHVSYLKRILNDGYWYEDLEGLGVRFDLNTHEKRLSYWK